MHGINLYSNYVRVQWTSVWYSFCYDFPLPIKKVKFSSVGARSANACVMREWDAQRQCMRNARITVLSQKLVNPDKSVLSDLPAWHEETTNTDLFSTSMKPGTLLRYLGSPYVQRAMKPFPRMLSVRWNRFRVCSACDEIVSPYAQRVMKSFPHMLSMRWNRFPVCSECVQMSM